MSPKKIANSVKALRAAERAVERAKAEHLAAFRKACVKLFNEYGLCLEESGAEGARINIRELRKPYELKDFPE